MVNSAESALITARADAAGLSVSAYLRALALGEPSGADAQALAQVDSLIAGMEAKIDAATAAVDVVLARLEATAPRGAA